MVVENLPVPPDRRVWLEATTLARHGYEVSIISPMAPGLTEPYEQRDGVHIYRHPLPMEGKSAAFGYLREYLGALRHWFRLARKIRRERGFDVIHGCNPPDLVFLLALAYRPHGVRFIFDHHDVCPELFEVKFQRRGPLFHLTRLCERLTFASAHVSIATNESFRTIAERRGSMAPENVFVVRSAPRFLEFRPVSPDPAIRQRAGTVLGYVGVIGKQEGMDLLVAAVDHLVNQIGKRDLHAMIVGFGPYLEALRDDVRARGLESHFTFTGPLFGEPLIKVLASTDICVSPDPRNAMNDISTMNKVLEYMTLGKPVVQFDLAEGRASAGEAALYAQPNDPRDFARQIARLIDAPDLRERMGQTGRKRVRDRLSWEHSVPALLAAYDRAFTMRRGGSG